MEGFSQYARLRTNVLLYSCATLRSLVAGEAMSRLLVPRDSSLSLSWRSFLHETVLRERGSIGFRPRRVALPPTFRMALRARGWHGAARPSTSPRLSPPPPRRSDAIHRSRASRRLTTRRTTAIWPTRKAIHFFHSPLERQATASGPSAKRCRRTTALQSAPAPGPRRGFDDPRRRNFEGGSRAEVL